MAVQAAHFTATSQAKPTIFEIIAQDSLDSTLHPALQKVAQVLFIIITSFTFYKSIDFD